MSKIRAYSRAWMTVFVLIHLGISIIHGTAHSNARVTLSTAGNVFVFAVILAGPLIGLVLLWLAERLGLWLIALTMGASLVFGVINHFVLSSPDHVAQVDPQFRSLFTTTAVLLAVTEAACAWLAVHALRGRRIG
jgi:hypothetical protein